MRKRRPSPDDPAAARAYAAWDDDKLRTVEEVAKLVGVSRSTLYRRTGGRRALLGETAGTPDETRERILDAAFEVLLRDGVAAATIAKIAREAFVGPVTIYRLFGDRASLFREIAARAPARQAGERLGLSKSSDVAADLTTFVRAVLVFMGFHRAGFASALTELSQPRHRALFDALHADGQRRTVDHVETYLRAQMKAGRVPAHLDARRAALALFSLVGGFGFLAPTLGLDKVDDVDDVARFIVRFFLAGIRGQP